MHGKTKPESLAAPLDWSTAPESEGAEVGKAEVLTAALSVGAEDPNDQWSQKAW